MPSIFSRIVDGEIPSFKVAETDKFLAFLDIRPQVKGHTLCIPKQEVDYIFDLDDETLAELMIFAKQVGRAIETVVDCKRIAVAVIGLEVPHTHVHLLPIQTMDDVRFLTTGLSFAPEELQALAAQIHQAYQQIQG